MDVRRSNEGPEHLYAVVFGSGEDPIRGLEDFARSEGLASGNLSAVGTFRRAVVGVPDGTCSDYERIEVDNPCDVVLLVGDIGGTPERPELNLRTVLGTRGGQAVAGHLLEAEVCSLLEVIVNNGQPHAKPQCAPRPHAGYNPCLWVIRRRTS